MIFRDSHYLECSNVIYPFLPLWNDEYYKLLGFPVGSLTRGSVIVVTASTLGVRYETLVALYSVLKSNVQV